MLEEFGKVFFSQFVISLILGIGFFVLALYFVDSPKEQNLKLKNSDLLLKYKILNTKIDNVQSRIDQIQYRDDNVYRPIFEVEAIPMSIRKAGFGGSNPYSKLSAYNSSEVMIQTQKRIDVITRQLYVQSKSYDELIKLIYDKEKMLASIPAIRPIANTDLIRFGSAFGLRLHPILNVMKMHTGIDLTARSGTKIYAAGDGIVTRADWGNGYGYHVRMNHGYNYTTLYAHMSKILVKVGQKVKRGDVIGLVGSTGLSTCPHLHYEVRKNGRPVNPINYYYNDLSDEEYNKMIEMSSSANTHVFAN